MRRFFLVLKKMFYNFLECFNGCASGCTSAGPKGCRACRSGYLKNEEDGCIGKYGFYYLLNFLDREYLKF